VRCRRAHNRDSRRQRGLSPEERQDVLAALRAGLSHEEAAGTVGRNARALQVMSVRDGELRAAMDGEPLVLQRLSRRGDFIGAMIRYGGNQSEAAREIGESESVTHQWVATDPQFAAVVNAVVEWVTSTELPSPRGKVTEAALDQAIGLLGKNLTVTEVSRRVGLSVQTLDRWGKRHAPLGEALAKRRGRYAEPVDGARAAEWAARPVAERIAEVVRQINGGATYKAAAAAVGWDIWALYGQRRHFPELAEAMPPRATRQSVPRVKRKRGPYFTSEADALLRELWGDPNVTVAELAARFGVVPTSVSRRARRLGLPHRGGVRRARDR
jgi:transposase-like protein